MDGWMVCMDGSTNSRVVTQPRVVAAIWSGKSIVLLTRIDRSHHQAQTACSSCNQKQYKAHSAIKFLFVWPPRSIEHS